MIGSLTGTVEEIRSFTEIVLNVNNVGYLINLTQRDVEFVLNKTEAVKLFVHTRVREDAISLYGFISKDDLAMFELLVKTHGIGPSLALAILNEFSSDEFKAAIKGSDIDKLIKVPGIGKKTATRLLVELGSELKDIENTNERSGHEGNVSQILLSLGYSHADIKSALMEVDLNQSIEEVVKKSLKILSGKSIINN